MCIDLNYALGFLTTHTTMVELSLSIKLWCEIHNEHKIEDEWASFWLDNDFECGYMQDVNGQDGWTSNNLLANDTEWGETCHIVWINYWPM